MRTRPVSARTVCAPSATSPQSAPRSFAHSCRGRFQPTSQHLYAGGATSIGQHGRPGVALTEVRRAFERLITQGVRNSEACRVVGINRRTGTRRRYGRDIPAAGARMRHDPSVITTNRTSPISARYLSEDERIMISELRRTGATVRVIAAELGRSPSTISREPGRHIDRAGCYRPSSRTDPPPSVKAATACAAWTETRSCVPGCSNC